MNPHVVMTYHCNWCYVCTNNKATHLPRIGATVLCDECIAALPEETPEQVAEHFYDHVDDKYSLAARDARRESVDSGNHDFI